MSLKIDWASLIVRRKFTVFALSVTLYLWANFQGGDLGGLIHGGFFFPEFYGNVLPDVRENGFREIFAFGIRIPIIFFNFCLYNPESSTLESGIPLMIVIRNPISTEKECGIHIDESRIQDCLGFPRNDEVLYKS